MLHGDKVLSGRISRAGAFTASVVAAGVLLSACGTTSTATPSVVPSTSSSTIDTSADAQVVSSLTLSAAALNTVYPNAGGGGFTVWNPVSSNKDDIGMPALDACAADLNFTAKAPVRPHLTAEAWFKTSQVAGYKWARSVTLAYSSTADANTALKTFGAYQDTPPNCSGPTVGKVASLPYIRSIGNTDPSWYAPSTFSPPTVVVIDLKQKISISAIAQSRGRFVIITYTDGTYVPNPTETGMYYSVKASPDALAVAAAATAALGQLTDAVVANG